MSDLVRNPEDRFSHAAAYFQLSMPLTSNYYNTDMTNKWLTQPAFTKDGSLQSFKQNNTGFDASSLPFGDQNTPVMGQERSSRLDSGFFDQLSFGEKLGLNNSCGSDKLTGTVAIKGWLFKAKISLLNAYLKF